MISGWSYKFVRYTPIDTHIFSFCTSVLQYQMEHSIRYAHAGSRESRQSYHSKVEHRWFSSNWLADVIGLGLSTWVSNTMWLLVDETQKSNTLLSPLIRRIPTPNPALLESVPDELTWGYPPGGKREVYLCLPLPCPFKWERFLYL